MSTRIEKKIIGYEVAAQDDASGAVMDSWNGSERRKTVSIEATVRPEKLRGVTYKVRSPVLDSAIYLTINDILVDEGLATEHYRPFEIFFNSKNMEHFQWIVALTRVMSAVFRKGGDVAFLVEELNSVFDPGGGYFKKGGKYVPSLVAEIGAVLEEHLVSIGMIERQVLDGHQRSALDRKRLDMVASGADPEDDSSGFPKGSTLCRKCNMMAVVVDGGCATCLSCGNSKCS